LSSPIPTPSLEALSTGSEPGAGISVEALVQTQLPWIRRRLRSLFPAHLDLDELEQKVLLNVLRSLPSYRGEGSLRAWVDSITVRVGLSHARRARARERRELALSEGLGDTQQRLPSEAYFTRRQVQGLLAVLPPEQERAVVLHHVIGLEVAEVAEHQGIPTETARSRLRLGMQKLRHRARVREIALP
jgi:RNA polymerase sigma-70 factor (ECF subfamily)